METALRSYMKLRTSRHPSDSFWDGRDRQFQFDGLRGPAHIHVIAGWNDMFLLQSLDDYVEDP
jgi:predicted acyl esterase